MRLATELDTLLDEGSQESQFGTVISSAVRELHQDWGRSPEQFRAEICDSGQDHPLLNFLIGLSRWSEERDYPDGAVPALEDLDEGIELALEEEWDDIIHTLIVQRIKLLSELNHDDELNVEIARATRFLEERRESLPIGYVLGVLEEIVANLHAISGTETVDSLTAYLTEQSRKAKEAGDHMNCRKLCRLDLKVREYEELETDPTVDCIIESYNDQIERARSAEDHSHRATVAKEAIAECDGWVDEEQRVEWEQEFIQGNKQSISQMVEISHEPDDEEIEELDASLEAIVEQFKEHKRERHAIEAIKWLLNQDTFIPDVGRARNVSESSIVGMLAERRTVSEAGESYSQEQGAAETPQTYGVMVRFTQNLRQTVYYRLQNRGLLKQGDLLLLINRREVLSANTHAFLTEFIIRIFDHDHPAAVHIGMAQLEAVLRDLAAEHGKSILSRDEETGELGRRPMSSLLYQIEEEVNDSWVNYLQYRYTDLSGQNIRNKIAHGYLPYRNANWGMSIILLFDILQNFLEFETAY